MIVIPDFPKNCVVDWIGEIMNGRDSQVFSSCGLETHVVLVRSLLTSRGRVLQKDRRRSVY